MGVFTSNALGLLLALVAAAAPGAGEGPGPGAGEGQAAVEAQETALAAFREGERERAAAIWKERLEAGEGAGKALAGLLRVALRDEDLEGAAGWARRAEELAPASGAALAARGELALRVGDLGEARGLFRRALEEDPGEPRAWLGLGRLRLASFRQRAGAGALREAFRLDPEDPEIVRLHAGTLAARDDTLAEWRRYLTLAAGEPEEFRRGVSEAVSFYEALGDTPLWVPREQPERVELKLRRVISSRGGLGGLVVRVSLDGSKPVRCLLDTGAAGLHLSPLAARKAGIEALSSGTVFGGGGDGDHRASRALTSLRVGGLLIENAVAQIAERELDPSARYSGILGLTPFSSYRITLDLKKARLLLELLPGREEERPRDDKDRPSPSLPPRETREGETLLFDVEGQLLVGASLRRGGERREALLLLDTGADRSVLDARAASELGPVPGGAGTGSVRTYGGRTAATGSMSGLAFEVGALQATNRAATVIDLGWRGRLSGIAVDGYLGLDLMKGKRLVLDLRRGTLRFEGR
jgi:tetratricopeptide (TPR) repeat protein